MAERAREGSAVKSAQRTNAHRAARCQEPTVPGKPARARFRHVLRGKNQQRKNSRRHAPNSWWRPEQSLVKLCSTALQTAAFLLAWNETDTCLAPGPSLLPAPQTHNDLKSQTRSRGRSPHRLNAPLFSHMTQSSKLDGRSTVFLWINDWRNGTGSDCFRRCDLDSFRGSCRSRGKLGLFHPCRHQHCSEQHCSGDVKRRARQMD
jgi:hypothetical protein